MARRSLCDVASKSKAMPELQLSCEEVEALYAIGFQKVSDHCKDEPVMFNFDVDWASCLSAHYPWVQILQTKICILKSDSNLEFLACYCSPDGNTSNRGFCISKIECLMNGQGINIEKASELEVEETCLNQIKYFLEANTNDREWFAKAQRNDKLRVRAPYHQDSPCFNENFSGLFDIGQLDLVDLNNGRMDVLSPILVPDTNKVMENLKDNVEEMEIDPLISQRMHKLSFFFEERIMVDLLIWIPGIILGFSTIVKEKGKFMKLFVFVLQFVIISVGLYNSIVPFIPESHYDTLAQLRKAQLGLMLALMILTPVLPSDSCEMTEYFLKISLFSFIPDIALWKVVTVMYTEERLETFKVLIRIWFVLMLQFSTFKVVVYFKKAYLSPSSTSPVELKRSNSRKKKENKKVTKLAIPEVQATRSPVQKKKSQKVKKPKEESIFSIFCQNSCEGVVNIGYVSVNCTETCFNQFHLQCWSSYLQVQFIQSESCLLGQACLTQTCSGRIFEIVWVDKYGKETARKDNYADLATVKKEVKQRGRQKPKTQLSRSYSEGSGGSSEDKSLTQTSARAGLIRPENIIREKIDLTSQGQQGERNVIRTFSTSYASMVKNKGIDNNNLSYTTSTDVVDEILELNCPEYFNQNCKMTEKSKILSLINKSREEQSTCVKSKLYSSSSAIIFVPGAPPSESPVGHNTKQTLPLTGLGQTKIMETKERKTVAMDVTLLSQVSSLTRIMAKHFTSHSLLDLDTAVKEVLATVRLEDVTIPEFRAMIEEKLEKAKENDCDSEIYMSDDDFDGDDEALGKVSKMIRI